MPKTSFLKIFLFLLLSSALMCALAFASGAFSHPSPKPTISETAISNYTLIIDAGHGGEDGGASSSSGLVEKEINLDISKRICEMLKSSGVNVVMTREDDRLLYDRNTNYKGRKKKLDLAARLNVMKKTENAIFISIHMNAYTDPKYSGLQVWYSQNDQKSMVLADKIQNNARILLQPENTRKTKGATSSIFLLNEAVCPAVLIECGFLSNESEAAKFENDDYRQKVAYTVFYAILTFLNESR